MKTLLIRTDCNPSIGAGHLMRCIALSNAWLDQGGKASFVTTGLPANLEQELLSRGIAFTVLNAEAGSPADAMATLQAFQKLKATALVVDGYQFDSTYQRTLAQAHVPYLYIDDHGHCAEYWAPIILNQNLLAGAGDALRDHYAKHAPRSRLLLGPEFALLRREFTASSRQRLVTPLAKKCLVTFGGTDAHNMALKCLEAAHLLADRGTEIDLTVVVGPLNPHLSVLKEYLKTHLPRSQVISATPAEMPKLMKDAHLLVGGAGSTSWEAAYLGLPALLVTLADNQRPIAQGLHAAGFAQDLGWHQNVSAENLATAIGALLVDQDRRQRMCDLGQRLVDGQGAARVASIMIDE